MVIPYAEVHLDAPGLPPEYYYLSIAKATRDTFKVLAPDGLAVTSVGADGSVLAVFGAVIPEVGSECEVFIFPFAALKKYPVTLLKDLRQEIGRMKGRFAKIRALSNTEKSAEFLQRLGFALEGVCKRPGAEGRLVWVMEGGI